MRSILTNRTIGIGCFSIGTKLFSRWPIYNVSVKSKLQHPPLPGHTPSIWHLCRLGEEGIWLSESSRVWGIWTPCKGVGNLNRSLDFMWNLWALCTWRTIMAGTRCVTNVDCILTDWQVNEVNWLLWNTLTDFLSLNWTFRRLKV